jgi:muramoyltetrapeptide carboxypeptidase
MRFEAGLTLLRTRYRVSLAPDLHARHGYLAGSDAARLAALTDALTDPSVHAIVAARGGYGATRLLGALDPALVKRAARWLVGFSDVTALHALWWRAGVCSVHGPMVCSLVDASDAVHAAWFDVLEGRGPHALEGLTRVVPGVARGPLVGGNLAVLCALVGTPHMPSLRGAVLLLEDVTERPYRLDRMLTQLRDSGALDGLAGVVLGQFTQCDAGPDGVTARDVLVERLAPLGQPMLEGAAVGHVPDNTPVLLGAEVTLDADRGRLSWL